jgi:thiol-disulfide isomerase/thioredoxin
MFRITATMLSLIVGVSLLGSPAISQGSNDPKAQSEIQKMRDLVNQLHDSKEPSVLIEKMYKLAEDFDKKYNKGEPDMVFQIGQVAEGYDVSEAKKIYQKVKETGDAQLKEQAEGSLNRLDMLGKPVAIQYTGVDGRNVDVSKLKGKVILVDFWATWCGPCVGEIPNVVEAYNKYHKKGFEIVGISFDKDKDSLLQMTKEKGMTWPQYFDGKQWSNDFGKKFGIMAIPTMWLIDKKGDLVDFNGRDKLEEKVAKLLK